MDVGAPIGKILAEQQVLFASIIKMLVKQNKKFGNKQNFGRFSENDVENSSCSDRAEGMNVSKKDKV